MDRYVSPKLYSVDIGKTEGLVSRPTYAVRTASELGFEEKWLQNAIAMDPRLVLDPCQEGELISDEAWWYWCRELKVDGGHIDVLLVSESGRLAIVETKLSYNPEKRRSVLAQVLEYAMNLRRLPLAAFPELPEDARRIGLRREQIEARLREEDYLLIIAGDQLDSRAVRLGRTIADQHLARMWELAMVEVAVYEHLDGGSPRFLVVPHLRGVIEPEVRQAIRVHVSGAKIENVAVEAQVPETSASGRERWTEERFFETLAKTPLGGAYQSFAADLRKLSADFKGVELRWGTGKTGSLTVKRNGHGLVEFYLDGTLAFRRERPPMALGQGPGARYVDGLKQIFPDDVVGDVNPNAPVHVYGPVAEEKLVALASLLRRALAEVGPA